MKHTFKIATVTFIVLAICSMCVVNTACSTERTTMYQKNHEGTKVINKNFRVKGTNKSNSSTYRSY